MQKFFQDIKKYYKYIIYSTKSNLKTEVANSYLNWLWWIIEPLCFMLIYTFIFSVVFTIIGNLSNEVKLDKFNKFFSSLFKWVIGGIFTIFLAIIAIKGLTASSIDGISIKTAKFALKTYIPILGGYLSDGFNLILASSMLIKNAVGGVGLLLFLLTIIAPIVNLVVLSLGLKLVAAIVEPISDNKIPNFIYSVANLLTMLIVCLIAVAFMYLIVVGLFMLSGNIL